MIALKSVLVRLQEYSGAATDTEKGMAKFLLKSPEAVMDMTIHQFAKAAYTSPSSVIRFCKKLGFQGYKDFHRAILYELGIRKEMDREEDKEITREDSLEDIVDKVTYKNIASLENTRKLIDPENLTNCIRLMKECEHITLFGIGSSLLVAKDAYLKFLRINKSCYLSDDWHAQLLQAQNMTEKDLAIIISYSGLTEEMFHCASAVKDAGARIIAITRFEDTPISRMADYTLWVAASELVFRSGAMSSRLSQLNMIDILYTAFINSQYESNMIPFKRTQAEYD